MDDSTRAELFKEFPLHAKLFVLKNHGEFIVTDFIHWLDYRGLLNPGDNKIEHLLSAYLELVDRKALKEEGDRIKAAVEQSEHQTFCLRQLLIYGKPDDKTS